MADQTQNPNGNGESGNAGVSLDNLLNPDGNNQQNNNQDNNSNSDNQNQDGNQNDNQNQNQQQNDNQNQNDNQSSNDNNSTDINIDNLVLDAEDNVIDKETGKVVIPKDKVKFDAKGNVIIPDDIEIGEGVKTNKVDTDKSALKALQETIGISPVDEEGKKIKYTDDAAGLINYTTDVVNTAKQSAVQEFLKANPVIQNFINHLTNGGKPQEFNDKIRFSTVQYDAANEKLNLDLIKANLTRKGITSEDADDMLTLIKTNGTWAAKGKAAYDELVGNEKALRDADERNAKAAFEKEQKEIEKYWKNAQDIVLKKGIIEGVTIPAADREGFFKYISTPVDKEGTSQFDVDYLEATPEKRMLLQYLVYKNMDFASLVEEKGRTLNIKRLADSKQTGKSINLKRIDVQKANQQVPTLDQLL